MQWYVVYTHPHEERIASQNLIRQDFDVYWPRYSKRIRHARKSHERLLSLFPRYLFVRFDVLDTGWRAIRSTRGVVDLVRNGFDPVPVSPDLIDAIRAREDDTGKVQLGRQIDLKKGQRFKLSDPAFAGQELIFECFKDSDRVTAMLSMLGREFSVCVPVSQILPTEPHTRNAT